MNKRLSVAVVGHTNTGKTSLMRTLIRKYDFGEVSVRPATTRHVERADISVPGHGYVQLFDTPGLEDSSGLYAYISALKEQRDEDWTECLTAFSHEKSLHGAFGQEAKALAQVLAADVVFYVIDAREAVRTKYRDELELLARCARPVLPVLNFVASRDTREKEWRSALARTNMHAVVAFDTVVFDEAGEISLYAKIATLAEDYAVLLTALIADLRVRRRELRRASTTIIGELLVDLAAARKLYPKDDAAHRMNVIQAMKDSARLREGEAVKALFALHRFTENSYLNDDLPMIAGEWSQDLFDPKLLERFGLDAGRAMAAGATAGLVVDLMVGGITLGAAAVTGAVFGLAFDSVRRYGSWLKEKLTGMAAVQIDDPGLHLAMVRESELLLALLKRGHGALDPVKRATLDEKAIVTVLAPLLKPARSMPSWSPLSDGVSRPPALSERRQVVEKISAALDAFLERGI